MDAAEGGIPLPGEGLKNLLEKVLADADARIPDRQAVDRTAVGQSFLLHGGQPDAAPGAGVGHGVVYQIHHQLPQLLPVAQDQVVRHLGAVQGEVQPLFLRLGQQEGPDLVQRLPEAEGSLLRPGLVGVDPGQLEYLVDHVQQLTAAGFDAVQIIRHDLRTVQVVPGQSRKAENSVQRRTHIVGHVGQEGVLGHDGGVGVMQGLLQQLLLLHLPAQFLVHPAAAQDDLGGTVLPAHIDKTDLQVLHRAVLHHPVIEVKGQVPRQLPAHAGRRGLHGHPVPVLLVDPHADVVLHTGGIRQHVSLGENCLRPAAEPVGTDLFLLHVHIEDGLVVDA